MRLHLSHLQARGHIYHAPTFQCCLRMQKLQMGAEHTQQVIVAGRRHSSQVTTSCMRGEAHPAGNSAGAAAQLAGDHQLHASRRMQVSCGRTVFALFEKQRGESQILQPSKTTPARKSGLQTVWVCRQAGVVTTSAGPPHPPPACVLESQRMPLLCSSASSAPSPPRSSGIMCCRMYLKRTSLARAS